MSPREFVEKWQSITQTERASAQSHFNDLCDLLGEPKPHDIDPTGEFYAFEKGAEKLGGANGWADVWKKDCFAWEYKGQHRDLDKALAQVKQYLGSLNNPPFMVACDFQRFIILSNWTNQVQLKIEFSLQDLLQPEKISILKRVFRGDPSLKSGESRAQLTQKVAGDFSDLARELQDQGKENRTEDEQKQHSLDVAHFVIRLAFCMYAEDAGLLGDKLFTRFLDTAIQKPDRFQNLASNLFAAMSKGGEWGVDSVEFFNGGLFEDNRAFPLNRTQIERVRSAAKLDWSSIDPSILGTLFERGLDPAKRSQLGAHYTDPKSIMRIVEPVILRPIRKEWAEVKQELIKIGQGRKLTKVASKKRELLLSQFLERLRSVRVLDPACGSGNFLYMALRSLKDLELAVVNEAEEIGIQRTYLQVGPEVLKGIEINVFAAELARVSIWIGELQWQIENGQGVQKNPILRPLDSIQCRDALLNCSGTEATWPEVDFIIGNPPFLGAPLLRRELGDSTTDYIHQAYSEEISRRVDLCVYWFYKSLQAVRSGRAKRVGLIATQGIRGGPNRAVMDLINKETNLFEAWDDLPWILDGAAVQISIACFGNCEDTKSLNGVEVESISSMLTNGTSSFNNAKVINVKSAYVGIQKGGPFELSDSEAIQVLRSPNSSRQPNSDVIFPFFNGKDISRGAPSRWLIDFYLRNEKECIDYEIPYKMIMERVFPSRELTQGRPSTNDRWWQHQWPRPEYRKAIEKMERSLVCIQTAKYRQFLWVNKPILPSNSLIAFSFDDDYHFGLLQSKFHGLWAVQLGTQLENRPRYTPTTCYETFPFPFPDKSTKVQISEIAKLLDVRRQEWLNPEAWTEAEGLVFPAKVGGPWHRWISKAESFETGKIAEAHYIRRVAKPGMEKILAERTLTKLYNENPAWLRHLHKELDEAVAEAYGFPPDLTDEEILARLLKLNLERAEEEAAKR